MVTLSTLKQALRHRASEIIPTPAFLTQDLSHSQYKAGFRVFVQDHGCKTYQDFVVPQLSLLLSPLLGSRSDISILEVGPGPKSVLGFLPEHLRRNIRRYAAFEPNKLFASELEEWLCPSLDKDLPLPCLEGPPDIKRAPFVPNNSSEAGGSPGADGAAEAFDVVLFCHSLYGMNPKHVFIQYALSLLNKDTTGGLVVAFHRGQTLDGDGLVCYRTSTFPNGVISVATDGDTLDDFSRFVAGYVIKDLELDETIRLEWRKVCHSLGRFEAARPDQVLFDSPNIMIAFNRHANSLPKLVEEVPLVHRDKHVKNWEARSHCPASIVRPTDIRQVQQCVQWALDHGFSLTILGGGHSGHCLWPNVVSIDMGAFDQVHTLTATSKKQHPVSDPCPLVIVGAGCKSGDIIRKTMEIGLTVPLGSRPSLGAGMWLQGGIGHRTRLLGLTCESVVGAVLVSVASGEIFCIGLVPSQHQPTGAVRPKNENDLMWALNGAGTNFGILVSITIKAYAAPTYLVNNWVSPLNDNFEARRKLKGFDELIAGKLPRSCSADTYLYWSENKLQLGVTMFESSTSGFTFEDRDSLHTSAVERLDALLGSERITLENLDGLDLFETEMYMSKMHGGHGGGKTSTFKRCIFLKRIAAPAIANILITAIETRSTPMCYLHLLQGGGAVNDVAADATAFGCRNWDFACVVTGVWARDHDGTEVARETVQWVYQVAKDLSALSSGTYGADLGPDPRDVLLAAKAFGPNQSRLAHLKRILDPFNMLAYACPLKKTPAQAKLILLVTGESCAGKDHCAEVWRSAFSSDTHKDLRAQTVSISDDIKQEYAAATGVDLKRLLADRTFKEQHRPALSKFFQEKLQRRPRLLEEQIIRVLNHGEGLDVLLITGMREEAPVASYSHLAPGSRVLEVRIEASRKTRQYRRGHHVGNGNDGRYSEDSKDINDCPCLVFNNDTHGNEAAMEFCENHLLPYLHGDLQRLANMVCLVPDYPRSGDQFRHVLNISQQPGGLALCTSLLKAHFTGDWAKFDAVASCETGGWVFASAFAAQVGLPFKLIREAGKLPPPTIAVVKSPSHISSSTAKGSREEEIEIGRDTIPNAGSVLVIDDVLATGNTLCAVLQLLREVGVGAENVAIMVVAEFPFHRGRQLLRQRGFGQSKVQSLLVFDSA